MKMHRLLTLALIFFLVSCTSGISNRVGLAQDRINALNMTPVNPNMAVVYIVRSASFTNSGITALFSVDGERIVGLENNSFTRIELPPGQHFFKNAMNEEELPGNKDYQHFISRVYRIKTDDVNIIQFESVKFILIEDILYGKNTLKSLVSTATYQIPDKSAYMTHHKTPEDEDLWNSFKSRNSIVAMDNFISKYPYSPYVKNANKRRRELINNEKTVFNKIASSKKESDFKNYLGKFPQAHNKNQALKKWVGALGFNKAKKRKYIALSNEYPNAVNYFPAKYKYEMQLMNLGPKTLTVGKLLALYMEGIGEKTLAAKVLAKSSPYKDFEIEEIKYLKKKGLPDGLIEAMIQATTKYNDKITKTKQNSEMMAEIKKLISNSQNNISANTLKQDNTNMPIECLKLKAALAACNETGGLLNTVCEITARSSFSACTIDI